MHAIESISYSSNFPSDTLNVFSDDFFMPIYLSSNVFKGNS